MVCGKGGKERGKKEEQLHKWRYLYFITFTIIKKKGAETIKRKT